MRMNQKRREKEHDAWRPPETQGHRNRKPQRVWGLEIPSSCLGGKICGKR